MGERPRCRPALPALALAILLTACDGPSDPFTSGPAHAAVEGVTADPTGTPIGRTTIRISCGGGGSALMVSTDSAGRYVANLSTGAHPFDGPGGDLPCHFREPAVGTARVQVDTVLGFARGPVLVPLQHLDLWEP